ncbi:endonuclease/exonuclease/phosphatase family protein [uncultured Cohaesibacter sp.]|uniref:endonuclease/exonuclease/phosphatase family protein n=1 Tax=uncultured Cohaesibacter sp. TaxID=1002546 RepID=UPI0029C77545|nr:endonuclease/exonuclease/phosphatase family protein [uncultured Cohaesibacter sp.]
MISRFRTFLDLAILAGATVAALLALSGLLGGLVPLLDLVNHFQLLIFLAAVVGLLASLVWPFLRKDLRHPVQLLLLVPLLCSSSLLLPDLYRRMTISEASAESLEARGLQPLKLMSFNIYLGTWDGDGLARSIFRHAPEVVNLQEFPPKRFRRQQDLKKAYPYQANCGYWRTCTLGILSKHPLSDIKHYDLDDGGGRNPLHGKMLAATIRAPGREPVRLYNVHLGWPLPLSVKQTQFQRAEAIIKAEAAKTPNQLVAGDFNATGWSFAVDGFADDLGFSRRSQFLPTFPSPHSIIKRLSPPAFLSLDHVLTSPTLSSGPVVRASAELGDHWPILTELYVPKR